MLKRNPETLQNCLIKFKKSWSDLDNLVNLSSNWIKIVGQDLAKECKPLKIEKNVLMIVANHPQWRHALIYNKHKLKESINNYGIKIKNIRIIQDYQDEKTTNKLADTKKIWDNHPCRIKNKEIEICKFCERPTPKGEIQRWGKCTFCWRNNN